MSCGGDAQVRQLAPMLGRHAPRSPLLLRLAATAGVTVESVSRLGVNNMAVVLKSYKPCFAATCSETNFVFPTANIHQGIWLAGHTSSRAIPRAWRAACMPAMK